MVPGWEESGHGSNLVGVDLDPPFQRIEFPLEKQEDQNNQKAGQDQDPEAPGAGGRLNGPP
jgi:hypothetical protein